MPIGKKTSKASWTPEGTPGSLASDGVKFVVGESEKEKAAAAVASTVASATTPTPTATTAVIDSNEDKLFDAMKNIGAGVYTLQEVMKAADVSDTFIRLTVPQIRFMNRMGKTDYSVKMDGDGHVVVSISTETSTEKSKPKIRVKAKAKPVEKIVIDPDFFYFNPTVKKKITAFVKRCRNVWYHGETGTGKSEMYERILEELGIDFFTVSFNDESSVDDLVGSYKLVKGETVWIDGALPQAMKAGVPLICEELDAAPAGANLIMQRVLQQRDGHQRKFFNTVTGENVTAKEGFCVLATANTAGGGDHSGLYSGVQVQNAAFRDRFLFEEATYPPAHIEVEILQKRTGIAANLAKAAVDFATQVRAQIMNGEGLTPVSTRTLIAFAMAYQDLRADDLFSEAGALTGAVHSAITDKASNPADREALKGLSQRVFGL